MVNTTGSVVLFILVTTETNQFIWYIYYSPPPQTKDLIGFLIFLHNWQKVKECIFKLIPSTAQRVSSVGRPCRSNKFPIMHYLNNFFSFSFAVDVHCAVSYSANVGLKCWSPSCCRRWWGWRWRWRRWPINPVCCLRCL